jgi:hypothetical protein
MQFWFWWIIRCSFKDSISIKNSGSVKDLGLTGLNSLVHLDVPVGGGMKSHIIKSFYVIKDFVFKPDRKVSMGIEDKRFKKNTQIFLRSFFLEKQVCFFFQMFYVRIFSLYNLRKLKLEMFENESGLLKFVFMDMVGVAKSYDLFKWSYQVKVNIRLHKRILKTGKEVRMFNSYFLVDKVKKY